MTPLFGKVQNKAESKKLGCPNTFVLLDEGHFGTSPSCIKCGKKSPLSAKTQHAMPSLTEVQNTAITLMDYFYFHDTASLSTYSVPKNEFFPHFTKTIDDVTYARGHQGKKFHLYQHFLLCYIETMAGTPQPLEVNNYLELVEAANRLLEKVASNVEKQGFALDEFRADIDTLDEIYKFATIKKRTGI
jgi:hypothetical protein